VLVLVLVVWRSRVLGVLALELMRLERNQWRWSRAAGWLDMFVYVHDGVYDVCVHSSMIFIYNVSRMIDDDYPHSCHYYSYCALLMLIKEF
jgi:hypothetical protein